MTRQRSTARSKIIPGALWALLLLLLCIHTLPAQAGPSELNLPNVELLNQQGQTVTIDDYWLQGRTVAIQFIFTRCGMVCPLLGYQFGLLRKKLAGRAGNDVQLISITVDPVHDKPAVLADWAKQYGAGPGWIQLTGDKQSVDAVVKAFKSFSPDIVDHTSLILIGNADHQRWQRLEGSTPVAELLQTIDEVSADPAEGP
ncbi:MAG: hypothetical protein Tsb002_35460 [Wenzhouxiangellaceae bacterium]